MEIKNITIKKKLSHILNKTKSYQLVLEKYHFFSNVLSKNNCIAQMNSVSDFSFETVSEEKKERIRAVIEETGYRPSVQARTLRTKRACLIGVIVPKINSESISRITEGIGQILAKSGYQMLLTITNNNSFFLK